MRSPIRFILSAKALGLAACIFVTGVDAAGTARISVDNPSVIKGKGPGSATLDFTLTRSGETGSAVTLQYRTNDNTAIAPGDYTAIPLTTITLAAGQTSAIIPVTINGDTPNRGDKSLFLHLTGFVSVQGAPANYAAASDFTAVTQALTVTVADVNGDGLLDLSVSMPGSNNVTVLLNTTAPGATAARYAATTDFTVVTHPLSVIAADVDGDGLLDLAVSNQGSDTIAVLLNVTKAGAPNSTYAATGNFIVGGSATPVDANGDGLQDLAVASPGSSAGSVLINRAAVFDNSEGTGTIKSDNDVKDSGTTPNSFSFVDQSGVERDTEITSAAVTITGIKGAAPISVSGGEYSIGCAGRFTSSIGVISDGQTVCVRHTSSESFNTATDTILTVGGVSDTFTSTTLPRNIKPVSFTFIDVANAPLNSPQTSNTVTIGGGNQTMPISVTGGEYSIGCAGTFTSAPGSISSGETVCVRHTSSVSPNTATDTTLTVGGVSDTFTSITPAPLDKNHVGSLGLWDALLGLLAALGFRRRPRSVNAVRVRRDSGGHQATRSSAAPVFLFRPRDA